MKIKNSKLKIKNLLIVGVGIFLFLFLMMNYAEAGGLVPCGGPGEPPCKLCHLFCLFRNIVNFILWNIVPPVAALMIAIGGFYFFFAEGKPEGIQKGKEIIKATLIGLVIIFAAWLIVNLFFQIIGVQQWTGLERWWIIEGCPGC